MTKRGYKKFHIFMALASFSSHIFLQQNAFLHVNFFASKPLCRYLSTFIHSKIMFNLIWKNNLIKLNLFRVHAFPRLLLLHFLNMFLMFFKKRTFIIVCEWKISSSSSLLFSSSFFFEWMEGNSAVFGLQCLSNYATKYSLATKS